MRTLVLTGGHSGMRNKGLTLVDLWEDGLCALYVALLGSHCLRCGKIGGGCSLHLGCWEREVWPRKESLSSAYALSINSSTFVGGLVFLPDQGHFTWRFGFKAFSSCSMYVCRNVL